MKEWLNSAEHADLATLARIEGNVVTKFPGFNGFEEFGYGSFLKFLTNHKALLEAIEEVGGMTQSGREGTRLGHQVSLNSVLDFIFQCGTQTSPVSLILLITFCQKKKKKKKKTERNKINKKSQTNKLTNR